MARLGRKQADKLHACGVCTLTQLANLAPNPTATSGTGSMGSLVQVAREAGIDSDVVLRHARQAKLQLMSRDLPVPTWSVGLSSPTHSPHGPTGPFVSTRRSSTAHAIQIK